MRPIRASVLAVAIAVLTVLAPSVHAFPALQLYSPDAVYVNDTWIISSDTFELWVVADTGSLGPITDVTLSASWYGSGGSISISGNPAAETYDDIKDKPGFKGGVEGHADYAGADGHNFYDIGDFTTANDVIYDYTDVGGGSKMGQIKTYMIHITGYDAVHFDAFDHYATGTYGSPSYQIHGAFAPFSHDATGGGNTGGGNEGGGNTGGGTGNTGGGNTGGSVPEPGTLALLGFGLIGLAGARRKK